MEYEFKCKKCGKVIELITARYIVTGERFSPKELEVKNCCKIKGSNENDMKLEKQFPLVADNSYQWLRAVEPIWPNGKDPGTRCG
jgi:hypothetical protein